jgi:hypothetical protein
MSDTPPSVPIHPPQISWISVEGNADISDNIIKFDPQRGVQPQIPQGGQQEGAYPWVVLNSDTYFQRGRINFEVFLHNEKGRCQCILNRGLALQVLVGFNVVQAAYGMLTFKSGNPTMQKSPEYGALDSVNVGFYPASGVWLKAMILVLGSNISLFVNGSKVSSAQTQISRSQVGLLLASTEPIEVRNFYVEEETPKAFVVMQFTESFNTLFEEVIKPVCRQFGYNAIRGDDSFTSGSIINEITQSIQDASVVIADITPDNPNVYYEVGYAHALNKPTILLSDKARDILPFDVSGFRTLFYEDSIGGKRKVQESLIKHLQSVRGDEDTRGSSIDIQT